MAVQGFGDQGVPGNLIHQQPGRWTSETPEMFEQFALNEGFSRGIVYEGVTTPFRTVYAGEQNGVLTLWNSPEDVMPLTYGAGHASGVDGLEAVGQPVGLVYIDSLGEQGLVMGANSGANGPGIMPPGSTNMFLLNDLNVRARLGIPEGAPQFDSIGDISLALNEVDVLIPVNASVGQFKLNPILAGELLMGPVTPKLHISREGERLKLSWVSTAEAFLLEESHLEPEGGWSEVAGAYSTNGVWVELSVATEPSSRYYRLHKPGI